jgi:CDP-4-dehydro-6-deoxyglucose reductase
MPVTWYDAVVSKTESPHPNVCRFWLKVPGPEVFQFTAGQFIVIDLPIGDKRLQRWRSYSIASAPDDSNLIELCISRAPTGQGTRYLFEDIKPGAVLRFKGPDGGFVLPSKIEKDLVFICTGTGVVPFRSMIQDLIRSGKSHRNIHLIFGTRHESGILYRDEFEALTRTLPGFRYDIVLSRQPDWNWHQGHVHNVYLEQYRNVRPDVDFYICGWSSMIDEAVANLLVELKYDRAQVHYELYG